MPALSSRRASRVISISVEGGTEVWVLGFAWAAGAAPPPCARARSCGRMVVMEGEAAAAASLVPMGDVSGPEGVGGIAL